MASSQPGGYDALGEFVDFSQIEFENANGSAAANANNATNAGNDVFTSTLSPPTSSNMSPAPTLKSESSGSGEVFSGPSHQYNLYKQQTPFVPGALHTAMAMAAPHNFYQDYLNQTSLDDVFDFNTPLETTGLDMDFQTSYLNSTINPNVINGQNGESLTSPLPSTTTTSTGSTFVRPWPGMHQQAALARAQQQRQQLERQRAMAQQAAKQVQKPRTPQTSDSIAQQSVQQIMNAIRAEPVAPAPVKISPTLNFPKKQKTEEEMDPDEKFLASEEAKKLDSRERRQLRNKVSARAFRSRRKEYISWLENELSDKHNENALLKAKNRALEDENARLSALTRELLMAPQFQDYLNDLANNPAKLAQLAQTRAHPEQPPAPVQSQIPHDMNPHQRAAHFQEQFQQFQQHQACFAA